jgi:hypothetical protein
VVGAIPVTASATEAFTFADVDWAQTAGLAGTAAAISLLTSFVSMPVGPAKGTPSLAPVE